MSSFDVRISRTPNMCNTISHRIFSQTDTSFDLGGGAAVCPYETTSLFLVDILVVVASQKAPNFNLEVDKARK